MYDDAEGDAEADDGGDVTDVEPDDDDDEEADKGTLTIRRRRPIALHMSDEETCRKCVKLESGPGQATGFHDQIRSCRNLLLSSEWQERRRKTLITR